MGTILIQNSTEVHSVIPQKAMISFLYNNETLVLYVFLIKILLIVKTVFLTNKVIFRGNLLILANGTFSEVNLEIFI